jgi:hypothetical protein
MKFVLTVTCEVDVTDNVHELEEQGFELDKMPADDVPSVEAQVREQLERRYNEDRGSLYDLLEEVPSFELKLDYA